MTQSDKKLQNDIIDILLSENRNENKCSVSQLKKRLTVTGWSGLGNNYDFEISVKDLGFVTEEHYQKKNPNFVSKITVDLPYQ